MHVLVPEGAEITIMLPEADRQQRSYAWLFSHAKCVLDGTPSHPYGPLHAHGRLA